MSQFSPSVVVVCFLLYYKGKRDTAGLLGDARQQKKPVREHAAASLTPNLNCNIKFYFFGNMTWPSSKTHRFQLV
jgi:hypothetical protein